MKGKEIRDSFLSFFEEKGHTVLPGSSLVPHGDPTLLFTNAGMVQFKGIFLGEEEKKCKRAVTVQKCLRAGGKHNDLENVGRTARHHTFFEMLGNFSFGDYFKEGAIEMAWEFLTDSLKLPKERLWVTVFDDDDDAFEIWEKKVGVSPERIIRCGEKDNFWSMGDTGPCGPCSEIHFDQGEGAGCGSPECNVVCDCDRYLEIWNLVFMQYNRDENGKLTPLPSPSIDTGMGLERLAAVVQGKRSNFDTDFFSGIVAHIGEMSDKRYGANEDESVSMRVIADHIRSVVFLISDGVMPSNEGKGYVLRRIMRRALRHGRMLGLDKPFLYLTAGAVADEMGESYPELLETRDYCAKVILNEEERFLATLDHGLKLLDDEVKKIKKEKSALLPGEVAFRLYDTYGFPLDLTEDILRGEGLTVDIQSFEREMDRQREMARKAWAGSGEGKASPIYMEMKKGLADKGVSEVSFVGYESCEEKAKILFILKDGKIADSAIEGEDVEIVTDQTPFYGESGGQAGDVGAIAGPSGVVFSVKDTKRPLPGLTVHRGKVGKGRFNEGDEVLLEVNKERRADTEKNHTATHLLHSALRKVLGDHVKQAGSSVNDERIRFDFSHFSALTPRELRKVEEIVNREIWRNLSVETEIQSIDEAKAKGATALFGEKYGERVRVVSASDFSIELCGGTHVTMTGEIGPFKIVSEGGVAAGVRRIEAETGAKAYGRIVGLDEELKEVGELVKGNPGEIGKKIAAIIKRQKGFETEVSRLKEKMASSGGNDLMQNVTDVNGINLIAARVDGADVKTLRSLIDSLKVKIKSGIVILGAPDGEKVLLIAGVTDDLTNRLHAGKIIAEIAPLVGGRGGGRADMAQAGGKELSKLDDAINGAGKIIKGMV